MKTTKRICTALLPVFLLLLALPVQVGAAASDSAREASITIHALQAESGKPITQNYTGAEIPELSGYKGLNGITFTVTHVQDGSQTVSNAPAHTGEGAYRKTQATARVNGQDGIAIFDKLPPGTYLVEQATHKDYTPATPKFLLEVPLSDPAGGSPLYNIHIYPKYDPPKDNTSDDLTKEVKKRTGNEVVWEFSWTILDNIGNGKTLTLTDELDDRLKIQGNGKSAVTVKYSNRSDRITTLNSRYYDVEVKSNVLTVTIDDDAAFEQLSKALLPESGKKKPKLSIEITTTIKSNASGTIYNSGELVFEDKDGNKDTSTPKKDPYVEVDEGTGGLCIYKYDGDSKKPLAGAEFKVFASKSDAQVGKNSIASGTTGSDGYVIIDDLEYEDKGTSYWIVETKAPQVQGSNPAKYYNLLPSPIEVKVGPNSHLRANRVEVQNNLGLLIPSPGNDDPGGGKPGGGTVAKVPDSGGAGRLPYRLAGVLLLAAAGLLWIRHRR